MRGEHGRSHSTLTPIIIMNCHFITILNHIPDQQVVDALLDQWAWRACQQFLEEPWSVQGFREMLCVSRVPDGWEVSIAGLDLDLLTVAAMGDSLRAFAEKFMAGVCYQQGLEHEELQ